MNLTFMTVDSKDLYARRHEQTPEGAAIRKEITRREKCGFWLGDFPEVKQKETKEEESKIGQVRYLRQQVMKTHYTGTPKQKSLKLTK